jgi:hypothetical protein
MQAVVTAPVEAQRKEDEPSAVVVAEKTQKDSTRLQELLNKNPNELRVALSSFSTPQQNGELRTETQKASQKGASSLQHAAFLQAQAVTIILEQHPETPLSEAASAAELIANRAAGFAEVQNENSVSKFYQEKEKEGGTPPHLGAGSPPKDSSLSPDRDAQKEREKDFSGGPALDSPRRGIQPKHERQEHWSIFRSHEELRDEARQLSRNNLVKTYPGFADKI